MLEIGCYEKCGVEVIILLLMDIQVLLNFEWFLVEVYGCDGVVVWQFMNQLNQFGSFIIDVGLFMGIWISFVVGCCSEQQMFDMIVVLWCEVGYLFDLYMVIGVYVVREYEDGSILMVVLGMVYLVKFLDVVEKVSGIWLELLENLKSMMIVEEC